MLLLTAYLILPVIVMTQAQNVMTEAENITQDLKLPALSESLLLYDVTSDSSISKINAALSVVNVRHSFKVVGENRYIVVITNNRNSTATQHVTFPEGSRVTQYPVEHIGDFLKMFGVNHGWGETEKENVVSTGQDLTMTEWEFITPPNTPTCVFKKRFAAFGLEYVKAHSEVKPVSFSAVASYPPKIFFIMNLEGNKLQEATMEGLDAIGGPGNVRITTKTITKI